MLHFLVVISKQPATAPSARILELLADPTCRSMPDAAVQVDWSSTGGEVAFGGWSDEPNAVPWRAAAGGLCAIGGEPVGLDPRGASSSALLAWLGDLDQSLTAIADETDGLYALIRFTASGEGGIVTDPFGIHTIYTAETATSRLYSNRPDLVAEAMRAQSGRTVEADAEALAMVALLGHMAGDATAYRGVSTLPFGCGVSIDRELAVSVDKTRPDPWDVAVRNSGPTADELDGIEDRMVRFARSVLENRPGDASAELTAGRDSRLVLAVLAQAGALDDVTFFTRGGEDSADFRGSATIAETLGLHFVRSRWPVPAGTYATFYDEHVERVAGQLGCWESSERRNHRGPRFSGLLGETLRAAFPRFCGLTDRRKLRGAFAARLRNGAGPMKQSVIDSTTERVVDLLFEPMAEGHPVAALSDIYYVQHQMRRLVGAQMERTSHHFHPLYVDGASRLAFRMGPDERLRDSLREGLMERAAVGLNNLDFKKADRDVMPLGQHAEQSGRYPAKELDEPADSPPTPGRRPPPRVDALVHTLATAPDSAGFDIVDRDGFASMVDNYSELTRLERMSLHRCLTPILFMRDR